MYCKRRVTNQRQRSRRGGFSLVELMTVMVILGLLAGLVTMSVRSYMVRGRQGTAKTQIASLADAMSTFNLEYDRYPTAQEGLPVLTAKSDKFVDGIMPKIPKDPWGNDYEYIPPAGETPFEIISYGADKREGGTGADADISSSELGDG